MKYFKISREVRHFELSEEAANNFRSQNVGSMKPLLAKNWVQTIWFKLGQEELRYSWYGQMLPEQMFPGQMSPLQLESVKDGPRNLLLMSGQNQFRNS